MGTFPGSLSEGAGSPIGLTEGVSSDGCSGPTIYEPAHINSEIFERLRSSGYTPSVSLSLDSSLREGAGIWCVPFNVSPGSREVAGDFHRPYESSEIFTFHHSTCRWGLHHQHQPHGQLRYRRNNQRRRRCPNLNIFSPHPFCPLPFPGFRRRKGNFFRKTL